MEEGRGEGGGGKGGDVAQSCCSPPVATYSFIFSKVINTQRAQEANKHSCEWIPCKPRGESPTAGPL